MKKYTMGFELWGLVLFLLIMMPNFIWFALPAPNDILRAQSATPTLDAVASVCQVMTVAALCMIVRRDREKLSASPLVIAVTVCCAVYYVSWIFYYCAVTSAPVILGLTVAPCLALILFALERRNVIALVPAAVFSVCHVIYAVVNFL